jgi:hypothetical protein
MYSLQVSQTTMNHLVVALMFVRSVAQTHLHRFVRLLLSLPREQVEVKQIMTGHSCISRLIADQCSLLSSCVRRYRYSRCKPHKAAPFLDSHALPLETSTNPIQSIPIVSRPLLSSPTQDSRRSPNGIQRSKGHALTHIAQSLTSHACVALMQHSTQEKKHRQQTTHAAQFLTTTTSYLSTYAP